MEAGRLHAGMAVAMAMRYICVSVDNYGRAVILTQHLDWWCVGSEILGRLSEEVNSDQANSNDHSHNRCP